MIKLYFQSEEIKEKEEKYYKERNICNRYTIEELKDWRNIDLYFVLGLDSFKDKTIPADVLTFVYKKQLKKYHPDTEGSPQEALFAVQNAYRTLVDPERRMKYDSVYFDESIPEDKRYTLEEFLDIFGACFQRNSKFSNIKPVPELGSKYSTIEEISSFYNFWRNFSSWRIFNFLFDSDIVMSSSERRDLEMKNKNRMTKLKVADNMRIQKLVDIALKRDPRINIKKESTIDPKLITNGWDEEEIEDLIKLLRDFKVGEKNRFDNITKKFNETRNKKKNFKEIFLKSNQINSLKGN